MAPPLLVAAEGGDGSGRLEEEAEEEARRRWWLFDDDAADATRPLAPAAPGRRASASAGARGMVLCGKRAAVVVAGVVE